MAREIIHGCAHTACWDLDAHQLEAHFAAGQCGQYRQIIAIAEMADTKHSALKLPQADTQGQVEPLVNQASQSIRVDARRRNDSRQDG